MEITVPVSSITFDAMNKDSLKVAIRRFRQECPCTLKGTKSKIMFVRPHRNGDNMVGIRVKVDCHEDDYPLLESIRNGESAARVNMIYKGFSWTDASGQKTEIIIRKIIGFRLNGNNNSIAIREFR